MTPFSEKKFKSLSPRLQHKWASSILRNDYEKGELSKIYRSIEKWLSLPRVTSKSEKLLDRYHLHLRLALIHIKEDRFLNNVNHLDRLSTTPFLPIDIYLDELRSSHNVGSIIRTTEAMRLGSIHFSPNTPDHNHPKVTKTAMGTHDLVPCHKNTPIEALRRPLIAFETTPSATSLFNFTFPDSFSLIVGNEEYGVCQELLSLADHIITIPLVGGKNSLNVASAFAIAAFEILRQRA